MFDWAQKKFKEGRDALMKEVGRFKSKDFMKGCVAVGTLISYADGVVTAEEKQKLMKFFEINDALKVFSTDEVIKEFSALASKFEFDVEIGKSEALQIVSKLRGKPDEARAAVRLGVMIAKSDGDFDQAEQEVLILVCKELGVAPEDFA